MLTGIITDKAAALACETELTALEVLLVDSGCTTGSLGTCIIIQQEQKKHVIKTQVDKIVFLKKLLRDRKYKNYSPAFC